MTKTPLLQGTLDLLILQTLALGPLHGLGIADRIQQVTRGALHIKAGSLFPALYRLDANGLVSGAWGESRSGRRAKLYTPTKAESPLKKRCFGPPHSIVWPICIDCL